MKGPLHIEDHIKTHIPSCPYGPDVYRNWLAANSLYVMFAVAAMDSAIVVARARHNVFISALLQVLVPSTQ